jgi:DNA-binding GntR family transcriptional regulator
LRDQIYNHLLEAIIRRDFSPGTRVKDTDLAKKLGVSRTPVRETLLRLAQERFLKNDPGRGFVVCRLDAGEIRETYQVLMHLESMALSTAVPLGAESLSELREITTRLREGGLDLQEMIEADSLWHDVLVAFSRNRRLIQIIGQLRNTVRRYEYAYMSHAGMVAASTGDHDEIISLLQRREHAEAVGLLKRHWNRSIELLCRAMDTEEEDK